MWVVSLRSWQHTVPFVSKITYQFNGMLKLSSLTQSFLLYAEQRLCKFHYTNDNIIPFAHCGNSRTVHPVSTLQLNSDRNVTYTD